MRDMAMGLHSCNTCDVTNFRCSNPQIISRILGCERCRIMFFFFWKVVFELLELRERRNLCLEIENGCHSKKRSKVGSICFIRRISSV